MANYATNSIKKDPSGSGSFAIKTGFNGERGWKVVSLGEGQHYVPYKDVADWIDMEDKK